MPKKGNTKSDYAKIPAFNSEEILLVAGLGNPDPEFAATYHNIGVRALEALLTPPEEKGWRTKNDFRYVKTGSSVFVVPRTYMNESGTAIRHALTYFKIPTKSLLVHHDDTDLSVGTMKIGFGRGSAGHHGIESIIKMLRTNAFWRARIGIRGSDRKEKARAFVLKRMRRVDEAAFEKVFQELRARLKRHSEKAGAISHGVN